MVKPGRGCCIGQQGNVVPLLQGTNGAFQPHVPRFTIDVLFTPEQAAAHETVLFKDDDPRRVPAGSQGRTQAGRAAAHYQDITMRVMVNIVIGVIARRQFAQPRQAADNPLVPVPVRPDKGLVVKPGRPEEMQVVKAAANIKLHTRPAILAARLQSVVQRLHRSTYIGFFQGAPSHGHQCIALLGAGGEDAAGAMVLEAAPHHAYPIGQQCRCQGIAFETAVLFTVETE